MMMLMVAIPSAGVIGRGGGSGSYSDRRLTPIVGQNNVVFAHIVT